MSDTIPRGSIIVGVDGSETAARALDWATVQARHEGRPLVVAHAIPPLEGTWLDLEGHETRIGLAGRRAREVRLLDQAREQALALAPEVEVHDVLRVSEPHTLLAGLGTEASMVVVGSRGLGPARSVLLSSVGRSLIRHPACPVVVHRPRPHATPSTEVLVGIDGSSRSTPVLEFAFRLADQRKLWLKLLHCFWEVPTVAPEMWATPDSETASAASRELGAQVVALTEKYPEVPTVTEVVRGDPQRLLDAMSEHQAMIVVGAHHPELAGRLPLSVTTSVLEHAQCPVAVVPVES